MNVLQGSSLSFKKKARLPLILQNEIAECGHACIAMVSNYLGHRIDIHSLAAIRKPSQRGVRLPEMMDFLDDLGLKNRALKVPLQELQFVKCPAILHWNMNHFVVLKAVSKNKITIHDPALGLRTCTMEEVSQAFTGVLLEVEKAENFTKITKKEKLTLVDLGKTVQGIQPFIVLLLLLSLSIEVLSLLNPLFMQYVTDDVLASNAVNNLYMIASGFFLLLLVQSFIEYIRANMVVYLTNNLTEQFSSNVVRHILKLPLEFFEKRQKGDIQSKFQSIAIIQQKISTDFVNTVLDGLLIILNIAVMLIYSPLLTGIVMISLVVYLLLRYLSWQVLQRESLASIYQQAKANSLFLETLQGIIPIKSFLKENTRFHVWRNAFISALNADIKIAKWHVFYRVCNTLIFQIEQIVVICIGAMLVLSNRFSIGMLIAFLSYRLLLVNKASSFIQNIFDYKLIAIQLERLKDILVQKQETIGSGSGQITAGNAALSLRNLAFKYHPQEPCVFENINLDILAGEKLVIVGTSGCGKSTLLKVMMGLLEKSDGEIYINNKPLQHFGLKNYRALTASVMQDDCLLTGSIINNITFFDEHPDLERVSAVAEIACIHDIILQLPMGYESLVGELGSTLSGGQKQRILLARALYKQPKILFLDEATSHLDMENEKRINQALKALDITQVIIAHRQETIAMADRVVHLQDREGNPEGLNKIHHSL